MFERLQLGVDAFESVLSERSRRGLAEMTDEAPVLVNEAILVLVDEASRCLNAT